MEGEYQNELYYSTLNVDINFEYPKSFNNIC